MRKGEGERGWAISLYMKYNVSTLKWIVYQKKTHTEMRRDGLTTMTKYMIVYMLRAPN